ncbi:MAG TPA: hypothetical protein VMA36_21440 [Candidatus Limnocylindria bacterium]|jgi:hypothetical protein|nr:hypothetical protein [Candidatus Limnocylindria bacterium]
MRRLAPILAVVLAAAFPVSAAFAAPSPLPMSTAAMPACPENDPVVWVNTSSNVYHAIGTPYFGRTKQGKYLCTSEAVKAGAHAAKGEKAAVTPTTPEPTPAPATSSKKRKKAAATPAASAAPEMQR